LREGRIAISPIRNETRREFRRFLKFAADKLAELAIRRLSAVELAAIIRAEISRIAGGPRGGSGDIKPRRDRKSVHFFTQRGSLLMRPTSRASIRLAAARGISSDKRIV